LKRREKKSNGWRESSERVLVNGREVERVKREKRTLKKMLLTSSQFSPAGHSFGDAYLAACFKFSSSRPELSGALVTGVRRLHPVPTS
jgi:hypothetical protein